MRRCPQCFQPATGAVAVCETCNEDLLEVPDLIFIEDAGFRHIDWERYLPIFDAQVPEADKNAVWDIIIQCWLLELLQNLGGAYQLSIGENIQLISDANQQTAGALRAFAQNTLAQLRPLLAVELLDVLTYRVTVLAFTEPDDYYDYVSHHYPEGNFPMSGGVFLGRNFPHIALVGDISLYAQRAVAHELTHYAFARLPLPTWLNEALAMGVERMMASDPFELDQEIADRLRDFWTEDNIQIFWSGESWQIPGDASELSYKLAEVLWQQLRTRGEVLAAFIYAADFNDAGQDAAVKHLGFGLETLVEEFLGPGNWRPDRRKLAESFRQTSNESSTPE